MPRPYISPPSSRRPVLTQQYITIYLDRAVNKILAEGMRRSIVLEHRLLGVRGHWRGWHSGYVLQRGSEPDAGAPDVRDHRGGPSLGYGRYLLALGEAARGTKIRLQDVQGALGDPAPEAHLAEQVLPGGDVGGGQVPQGLVPFQVFRRQGLLEEVDRSVLAADEDASGRRGARCRHENRLYPDQQEGPKPELRRRAFLSASSERICEGRISSQEEGRPQTRDALETCSVGQEAAYGSSTPFATYVGGLWASVWGV